MMSVRITRRERERAVVRGVIVAGLAIAPAALAQSSNECQNAEQTYPQAIETGDYFGTGIDIDGDLAIIGASERTQFEGPEEFNKAGAAFLFFRSPLTGEWTDAQIELEAESPDSGEMLGESVALTGEWAFAAAPNYRVNLTTAPGGVFVFRYDSAEDEWDPFAGQEVLIGSDSENGDKFGGPSGKSHQGIAADGLTLVVGAPRAVVEGAETEIDQAGKAYVHQYDSGADEWVETQVLTSFDPAEKENFGWAVDYDGTRIIVGAPSDTEDDRPGRAYIFTRDPVTGDWEEDEELTASNSMFNEPDRFGHSVAIDGADAAVGAPGMLGVSSEEGEAYVYRYENGAWAEHALLTPSNAAAGIPQEQFGWSIDIEGGLTVVGARAHKHPDSEETAGAAYLYQRNATGAQPAWDEVMYLLADEDYATFNDRFGDAVTVDGDEVFIGATGDEREGEIDGAQDGIVYIFPDVPLCTVEE